MIMKPGVPLTPAFFAMSASSSTFVAAVCASKSLRNFVPSIPSSLAQVTKLSVVSDCWFANALSWNFQNASEPFAR